MSTWHGTTVIVCSVYLGRELRRRRQSFPLCMLIMDSCIYAKLQADNFRRAFVRLGRAIHMELFMKLSQTHCFYDCLLFRDTVENFSSVFFSH